MASSSYRTFCAISHDPDAEPPIDEFVGGSAEEDCKIFVVDYSSFPAHTMTKTTRFSFLKDNCDHTCRETALDSLRNYFNKLKSSPMYGTCNHIMSGILYTKEGGGKLGETRLSLIKRFIDATKLDYGTFRIVNDNQVLFTMKGYAQSTMIMASMFFYIFRVQSLLEKYVEVLEQNKNTNGKVSGTKIVLKLLIPILLENWRACDASNPSIITAYYCYLFYVGGLTCLEDGCTVGPVMAATKGEPIKRMVEFYTNYLQSLDAIAYKNGLQQAGDNYSSFKKDIEFLAEILGRKTE